MESHAIFLEVVEHRLIPARARSLMGLGSKMGLLLLGLLLVRIPSLGTMLVLVLSVFKEPPLTLPSFCTSEFRELFRLGRAARVILPLARGRIADLFVIFGYRGSGEDPHKLALTNSLLEAVLCEASACGTGQLVILSDVNAEPSVIPVAAKALKCGYLFDLEGAYADGGGAATRYL